MTGPAEQRGHRRVVVVLLSVTLGLAGALLLTQIWPRARAAYYTLITAPILMPGVVIGIATVLFWDRVATPSAPSCGGTALHGIFLTMLGQSCFIAAYCMLVFVARLQRFDEGRSRRRSISARPTCRRSARSSCRICGRRSSPPP